MSKGIKQAAVTRGDKPTLFYDEFNPGGPYRGEIDVPKESKLVSTSGAGDVQHGAAAYFIARGRHFGDALYQANRVSSFSTSFPDKRQFFKYLSFDVGGNLHIDDPFASGAQPHLTPSAP
jgi:sugar/nucleoside kinase (ribokinase family)